METGRCLPQKTPKDLKLRGAIIRDKELIMLPNEQAAWRFSVLALLNIHQYPIGFGAMNGLKSDGSGPEEAEIILDLMFFKLVFNGLQ